MARHEHMALKYTNNNNNNDNKQKRIKMLVSDVCSRVHMFCSQAKLELHVFEQLFFHKEMFYLYFIKKIHLS